MGARDPEQFALILGTPGFGFKAQPGSVTSTAVLKFGMPMTALLVDAHASGQLAVVETTGDPVDLSDFSPIMGAVPAALIDIAMRSWSRIHGVVILEAFGILLGLVARFKTSPLVKQSRSPAASVSRNALVRRKPAGAPSETIHVVRASDNRQVLLTPQYLLCMLDCSGASGKLKLIEPMSWFFGGPVAAR